MPTFYDPIELEEIDFNDPIAKFYLIRLPNDAGFKLCATTQNLDSPQMIGGDPVTRVQRYWPITLEQLNASDLAVLFPDNSLRAAPMTLLELNEAFHFISPFNPETTPSYQFGLPQHPQVNNPIAAPTIPNWIHLFAETILVSPSFVSHLFFNSRHHYRRLTQLTRYIQNHNRNAHPHAALTLEQIFTFTTQEVNNLDTGYQYILNHHLSIEEVRALSETERQHILANGLEQTLQQALANLREYQEQMSHGHAISP